MTEPTVDPDQGTLPQAEVATPAGPDPVIGQPDPHPRGKERAVEPADDVERARDSLEATLAGLKLTPEEEKALASEIQQLRELTKKLDESTIEIAAFGMVSRGKS